MAWSGPVWPAATTLPDFRGKNGHVNSLEERIVGCFSFSMNGIPPAYGSDDMLAITLPPYMAKVQGDSNPAVALTLGQIKASV